MVTATTTKVRDFIANLSDDEKEAVLELLLNEAEAECDSPNRGVSLKLASMDVPKRRDHRRMSSSNRGVASTTISSMTCILRRRPDPNGRYVFAGNPLSRVLGLAEATLPQHRPRGV